MLGARGWPLVALGGGLLVLPVQAAAQVEPEPVAEASQPAATSEPADAEPQDDLNAFADSALADEPDQQEPLDPFAGAELDVTAEPIPAPSSVSSSRSGRGAIAVGGALLGLGALGRVGIEAFWAGPARLEASEPFGRWSIPSIALFTAFSNVFVVPGLLAAGLGARRLGRWRVASGRRTPDPVRVRRNRRLGWGLLGGGLSLWAVTRAAALPVLRACPTNGCAYGYLESSFWLSLGAAIPGVVMVGLGAGERRRARDLSVVPMLDHRSCGLALGGRF